MRKLFLATLAVSALLLTSAVDTSSAARTYSYGQVSNNSNGQATVTGRYRYCGSNSYHGALDVAAPCGKWALANISGKRYYRWVKRLRNNCGYSNNLTYRGGNYYYVNGSNGYLWYLAHLNSYYSGTKYYNRGQRIAKVGSTGNSTGAHTHMSNMRNWTKHTSWMTSYYTSNNACGRHPNKTTPIGRPRMS